MWDKWITGLVVKWVISQLGKYGSAFDWAKAEKGLRKLIAPLPDWIENGLVEAAEKVFGALKCALADAGDLRAVVEAAVAQDWPRAAKALQAMLGKCAAPEAGKILADIDWDVPLAA